MVLLVAAACARPGETATGTERGPGGLAHPPDVTVHGGGSSLVLQPYTFCYENGCADGAPPDPPPEIGSPDELVVEFPEPDWTFTASFQRADDPCARTQTAELERLAPTRHRLTPYGAGGTYDVNLFGRGDGDLFVSLRWTTPADGPPPEPEAWLGVLASHDGTIDSYGVEMSVTNLAASPERASARITVTAAGGEQLAFDPTAVSRAPERCDAVEGALSWDGPDVFGRRAATLGDPPFTYTVALELDSTTYVATATWPDDEDPDRAPAVPLTFDPSLPALGDQG